MNTPNTEQRRRPGGRVPIDAEALRAAITESGLSLRELARRSGMTVGHISGVLNGTHGISTERLRRITAELQIPYASVIKP